MKAGIEIAGAPFVVEFSYRIISRATPPSRDDPGSPLEFEVTHLALYADKPKAVALDFPPWLAAVIVENLQESYDIIDDIEAADGPDPDDARDARMERDR
jgi:hypothetical protein